MEIPGGDRKEARLGAMPAVKEFEFDFREKRFRRLELEAININLGNKN
jgi:hypothetical protein